MRFSFLFLWVRLVVEVLRDRPVIRRYRVVPAVLENSTRRLLCRRIARRATRSGASADT